MVYILTDLFIDQFKNNEISGQINFYKSGTDGVYIWRNIADMEFIQLDFNTRRLIHTGFDYKINSWLKDQLIYPDINTDDLNIIDLDGEEADE